MTFKLGLTGSIGMGKSTTAQMFVDEGCALWDADAAVHQLYAAGGAAVAPISTCFPSAIVNQAISRQRLKDIISVDPKILKKIENIVHPLVTKDRELFLQSVVEDIAVLDIPLLFETGNSDHMDAIACVSIPIETQRTRVLERKTMTEEQFEQISEKQIANDHKCALSDYVIVTDTLDHARAQVKSVVADIREKISHA
ncbi:MAG: dephospho-CoA kinase [Roseobacter sp.]